MRLLGVLAALHCLGPTTIQAQSPAVREALVTMTGPAMFLLATRLPEPAFPACGPCDRSDVPAFDRWVIHRGIKPVQAAGYAVLGGLIAYSWTDLAMDRAAGFSHVRASFESFALAAGVARFLKETFHRPRPAWYTTDVVGQSYAEARDNMRSLPSGDTSIAFAFATSYVLSRGKRIKSWQRILAFGAASTLALSRVAGGKHFPTDVIAGAAVGMGSAWLVHTIRF